MLLEGQQKYSFIYSTILSKREESNSDRGEEGAKTESRGDQLEDDSKSLVKMME